MARTTRERSRLGNTVRWHPDDHEAIAAARRDLEAAKLEKHIRDAVAKSPPLTADQRAQLAMILSPAGGSDAPAT